MTTMIDQTILTKTSRAGLPIEIKAVRNYDRHDVVAYVDGKQCGSGFRRFFGREAEEVAATLGTEYTHRAGDVVLTADEAAVIAAALRQLDQSDPTTRMHLLRSEREAIAARISGNLDHMSQARDAAFDSGDPLDIRDAFAVTEQARVRDEELHAALAAFDAAHPEVVTAIEAQRQAELDRFLLSD